MIHIDHESLKHLKGQGKLNKRHVKWVEFLESFPYVIAYKQGKEKVVANALFKRYALIIMLTSKLLGFEHMKDLYITNSDFISIYADCESGIINKFYRYDSFLFRDHRICMPTCSIRELLVRELHSGGLVGHFNVQKTLDILIEHFYWPHIRKDVERICVNCIACK